MLANPIMCIIPLSIDIAFSNLVERAVTNGGPDRLELCSGNKTPFTSFFTLLILTIFRPSDQTPPALTPETITGSVLVGNDGTNYTSFSLQNTAPGTAGTQSFDLIIPAGTNIVPASTLTMAGSFILPAGYGLSGNPQAPNLRIKLGDLTTFFGSPQTRDNFAVRVRLKATPA